jgi:hypothetical protein
MGRTAVEVVAQYKTIVNPKNGAPYVRKSMNLVRSPKLQQFNSCIRSKLGGQHFPSREAARAAFGSAASTCRNGRGYAPEQSTLGRKMGRRY